MANVPNKHLMVDIETLGTNPGCAVVSIGAVWFDPEGNVNRSLGIRIAAEFHARLMEQLTMAVNGELNELEARLLLREVEVAG